MSAFQPYPPTTHHTTIPLPPARALALLTAYLTAATTNSSLHPNALLTETGPIAQSSGSNTGLVLHNLKRVEAGLRGEHLAADLTFKEFGGEGLPDLMIDRRGEGVETGGKEGGEEETWQDKGDFEREQDIVQGELGPRGNGVEGGEGADGMVPRVKETLTSGDKKERKERKRGRRKQLQKEAEVKKRREKVREG